jgi:uncharacterized RDD family membrane protein YckC
MARWHESWLPGSPVDPDTPAAAGHPGAKFGLPREGVGATVGFGRRLGGVAIDWIIAYALALFFSGLDALGSSSLGWTVWLVWFALTALPTAIFGMTPGMVALGMRVARVDMAPLVGLPRALLRTLLLGIVVPPIVRDDDGRGWHDRATRTIVIRAR